MSANLLVQARKLRMSSDLARDVRLCAMARDTSQCEFIRKPYAFTSASLLA